MANIAVHVITKKEQESIQAILDSGCLGIKNGSATLHFDKDGTLRSVEIKQITFRFDIEKEMPYNG